MEGASDKVLGQEGSGDVSIEIRVGDTLSLEKEKTYIIGRSDFGQEKFEPGLVMVCIEELKNAITISRYALMISLEENGFSISHAELEMLDGEKYKSKNKISLKNLRGKTKELEDGKVFKSKRGNPVDEISVYDGEEKNGFVLKFIGNTSVKLEGLMIDSKVLKHKIGGLT